MNWTLGHSGVSYSRHLLEEAAKLLPVKDSAIVNTQFHSLDEAGFLCPIVMPALQSLLCGCRETCCVPPPYRPYVMSSSLMAALLSEFQCSGTTEHSIGLILITSAYYW